MKKIYILYYILSLFIFIPHTNAENQPLAELTADINTIIQKPCLRTGKLGVKAISLTKSETLYENNSEELLIPASIQKILTTAAALNKLKADYVFKTILATDGKIEGEKIKGDLYIKGHGDPKLVSERLWLMVKELYNLGIRSVEGNIIADDSFFDDKRRVDSWPTKRRKAYDPSIGALSLNFNIANLYVEPAKAGTPAKIILDPLTDYFQINNKAVTVKGHRNRIVVSNKDDETGDIVTIRGKIGDKDKLKFYFINASNPPIYMATAFKNFATKEGMTIKGNVVQGTLPNKNITLIEFKSLPLGMLIRDVNKRSNNFMAEQILKTLGAELKNPPGTTEKGLEVLEEFLTEVGIAKGSYVIKDGSGYSRENRLSANQLVKVLEYIHRDFKSRAEFESSLAVAGADSMKRWASKNKALRQARVKTGTLNGVSTIAGYLDAQNGEEIAFSIIINNNCDPYKLREIQIKIITTLLDFTR